MFALARVRLMLEEKLSDQLRCFCSVTANDFEPFTHRMFCRQLKQRELAHGTDTREQIVQIMGKPHRHWGKNFARASRPQPPLDSFPKSRRLFWSFAHRAGNPLVSLVSKRAAVNYLEQGRHCQPFAAARKCDTNGF